ncbi:MAG: GTP-binding protein [Methylococcaceae bacterium NSM2-1]|nr:MAG: GTP-binding protein [Methylococcaceae bacterium NSM2-1]
MLPVIALVGRPNVGKSTLFNYLTRSREALVADFPGLTRDRQYGRVKHGDRACLVVDTGGIADDAEGIESFARKQVQIALEEADIVLFMVDAREGLSASDKVIADTLRKLDKPVILVTNKVDGIDATIAASDFYSLLMSVNRPWLIGCWVKKGLLCSMSPALHAIAFIFHLNAMANSLR